MDFRAGQVVVRQGDAPTDVYFVMEGRCAVVKDVEVRKANRWPTGPSSWRVEERCAHKLVPCRELGPGSCFGERGILGESRRQATVTAETDAALLALDKVEFEALIGAGRNNRGGRAMGVAERRQFLQDDEVNAMLSAARRPSGLYLQEEDAPASPPLVSAVYPRRGRVSADYPRPRPRRRRDSSPRNIRVPAAA